MYLKSIEIQGFKSFAKKINFEFPEGITGIVGPNGSGKSNVADAVRWVLGEQKIKQLRGSKMEDVIFAGTANRKPLGFAQVAITLDNSDRKLNIGFDEITILRRVFRSGESEYMINGSACRLRDLQELFYDTGIGKEGYSIIGQGQIDKILQGKPEERREIFDEAAGIVKYKKRKTIALRKLESERANISRISDILKELGRQAGPLGRQAEAAGKFVKYKEDLKRFELNYFLLENGEIRGKISALEEKIAIASDDLAESKAAFENTKEEFERISEILYEIDGEISKIKDEVSHANVIKEKMEGQIRLYEEQINSISEAGKAYDDRVKETCRIISEAEDEKQRLEEERKQNEKNISDLEEKTEEAKKSLGKASNKADSLKQESEAAKEKIVELINAKGEVEVKLGRLNTILEQMENRKQEIKNSIEQFNSDKTVQEERVCRLKEEYDGAAATVRESSEKIAVSEAKIKDSDKKLAELKKELEQAGFILANDTAKLESLKNITERYEGYGSSIKEVMALKSSNRGIHGVVADIIQVDKKYETAIEIALGGSIQNIVTDTEETAKKTIEYLKANKLGRATFLPLQAVKGRGDFRNEEVLDETGVIGLASELVKVEEKYKGIAKYLLGRVVVVDNINHALAIARKYNYSLLLVTLDGEYLNKGGALTGGAFRNKSSLLSRRREIEELTQSIEAAKATQKSIVEETERTDRYRKEINEELDGERIVYQQSLLILNTIEMNLKQAKEKQRELMGGFEKISFENQAIDEKAGGIRIENTSLNGELAEISGKIDEAKEHVGWLEAEIRKAGDELATKNSALQDLRMENLHLEENRAHLSASILRLEAEIEKQKQALDALAQSNRDGAEEIKEKQAEIEKLKGAIESGASDREIFEKKLEELEAEKERRAGSHKSFIEKREEYSNRVAELDKELFRLNSIRDKLEESFENKLSYIWEEYELTYSSALKFRDEALTDGHFMKEKISELKSSIRGLGSINVSAIEEYKEVKERYDFLKGQYDDLLKAEADLVKIIRDLDREMRKQFNREFGRIKTEFSRVFIEMFGGGTGTIELEEDVDVLDAGISIIAQPPGKKLQNMMQLSGGEKALTAIAVLFAIQNLKPSPFCILDEIEAALDDANIDRFAGYLNRLSKGIQFVVITHRKGTMEAAHRLYGITMQEKGVSSLISVNLEDVPQGMVE